jgi:hypothetical protein
MGDDASLAGASAGEDEQGTLRSLDGSALLGIEMCEKGVQECVLWGQVPESSVSFGRIAVLWEVTEGVRRVEGRSGSLK